MIDNNYRNAFKEVYEILKNTDEKLLEKIPESFSKFIADNMNKNFKTNVKFDEPIDRQDILKETEAILALIYRSYWDEENNKNHNNIIKKYKDINDLFSVNRNLNKVAITKDLIVVKKESFLKRIINRIFRR